MGKRIQNKQRVKQLLRDRDWNGLTDWFAQVRNPIRILRGILYDPDPLIRWRAVEAMGKATRQVTDHNMEKGRNIVRQLLWLMNDESGGLLWNGPEVIALILQEVPALLDEFGPLLTTFLREEPFEQGTHWALSLVVKQKPHLFLNSVQVLSESLQDPNPSIRAHALLALQEIDEEVAAAGAIELQNDGTTFSTYDLATGEICQKSVRDIAIHVLKTEKINHHS
ncbi:DVU0298 family protein [candidate division CSSED10-310 bacterium]|uniref:DVU0298 family protein n=1 Tax=candidate division CSSED10-310 bacterium TaxID=2855610 RepID=A0ABV6Z4E9_UNCC1